MSLIMYDSVTVSAIPPDAWAVAGYVNGRWPTFPSLVEGFPFAHKLSIAVTARADADCLDIERGDATPEEAPAWVRRQMARGLKRPVVYCSLSDAATVLAALRRAGIGRVYVRLWTAHYTGRPHRCGPLCGFGLNSVADATQYTNRALGRNLDASLCSRTFFSVSPAVERKRLRAWILARRAAHWSWKRLKATPQWARWRRLGGH